MSLMLKPIIRAVRFAVLASVPGIVMAQQTGEAVYLPALDVRSLVPTSVGC